MGLRNETIEVVSAASNKATIAGAGMTGVGFLTSSQFFGLVGIIIAIGGFLVNWYYKREANRRYAAEECRHQREEERREREHEMRMQLMRYGGKPVAYDAPLGELGAEE